MGKVKASENEFCVKVYYNSDSDTAEKNAKLGVTTDQLQVDSLNGRYSSGLQADGSTMQYFIGFRKYWFRIEFNEPVIGFYIDWDDGEDNSAEKSNSQIVYLEKPQHFAVVSHIYTKYGPQFPLIRAINTTGFWSKYYTTNFGDDNFENEWAELEEDPRGTLVEGQNEYSLVSTTQKDRGIPHFYPSTLPPVAVLKVDRGTVYSGIDNNIVEKTSLASSDARRILPSIVYADYEASGFSQTSKDVDVEVTFVDINGYTRTKVITTKQNEANLAVYDVRRVVKARLLNLSEGTGSTQLAAGERVYLRACKQSSSADGAGQVTGAQAAAGGVSATFLSTTNTGIEISPGGNLVAVGLAENNGFHTTGGSKYVFGGSGCTIDSSNIFTIDNITGNPGIPNGAQIQLAGLHADYNLLQDPTGPGGHSIFTAIAGDANTFTVNLSSPVSGAGYTAGAEGTSTNILDSDDSASFKVINMVSIGESFSTSTANAGAVGTYSTTDPVICTLSLGWPELSLDDRAHFVTADFSESRTRASNLDIPFDDTHIWFDDGKFDWIDQTKDISRCTDIMNVVNKQNTSRVRLEYTQDPFVDNDFLGTRSIVDNRASATDSEDGTGRFIDDFRHLRLQVRDNRATKDLTGSGGELSNDQFSYSILTGWRRLNQTMETPANTTTIIPDELDRANGIWFTSDKGANWSDVGGSVDDETNTLFTPLTANTFATSGTQSVGTTNHTVDAGGIDETIPLNYLLMVREEKFDGVYFGIKNIEDTGLTMLNTDTPDNGIVAITLSYPSKDTTLDTASSYIRWKPLAFIDYTKTPKKNTSLYVSGPVMWDVPDDWEKVQADTTGFGWPAGLTAIAGDTEAANKWFWDGYAILVSIHYKSASGGTPPLVKYIHTINNEHTSLIRVQDSMHVSLNDILIAQSVSWKRNGRYQVISDRIGKSELRKIGAEGGSIRFGGISFGDYATEGTNGFADHKKIKRHQQEGTPVYIDMEYPNGNKIRFFGKIMGLSEDIPTGRVSQKWAIDLGIEAIAEFKEDGTWVSDGMISIGGEIDDRSQYI